MPSVPRLSRKRHKKAGYLRGFLGEGKWAGSAACYYQGLMELLLPRAFCSLERDGGAATTNQSRINTHVPSLGVAGAIMAVTIGSRVANGYTGRVCVAAMAFNESQARGGKRGGTLLGATDWFVRQSSSRDYGIYDVESIWTASTDLLHVVP